MNDVRNDKDIDVTRILAITAIFIELIHSKSLIIEECEYISELAEKVRKDELGSENEFFSDINELYNKLEPIRKLTPRFVNLVKSCTISIVIVIALTIIGILCINVIDIVHMIIIAIVIGAFPVVCLVSVTRKYLVEQRAAMAEISDKLDKWFSDSKLPDVTNL